MENADKKANDDEMVDVNDTLGDLTEWRDKQRKEFKLKR